MKKIILKISGMTCSACSQGLRSYLEKQDGIIAVEVNLMMSVATITYENITIKDIEKYIEKAGFKSEGEFKTIESEKPKDNIKMFFLMGLLLLIVCFISIFTMLNNKLNVYLILFILIITILFLIYGKNILINGIKNLLHQIPNMDTLVSLSVVVSFLYSLYGLIKISVFREFNNINLYFESICMVIYFVKLGRFIEEKSMHKSRSAIEKLVQITPSKAFKKNNNEVIEVLLDDVRVNDILICRSGEKIAVDGTVLSGEAYFDESFITGESKPVLKEKGKTVIAGSICYDGMIEYQAKKIGRDSLISGIVKLVIEATNTKNKFQRIADKISGYFVYTVITIAILTFIIQLIVGLSFNSVINHVATILVIACPCALGLSVPLAIVVSNGYCASKGLFMRNGEILELAKDVDTIIFDKTGTLTYGKLQISKFYNYSRYDDNELLNIVANVENLSLHPIKTAFKITKKLIVKNFSEIIGIGVKANVNNQEYYLGSDKILDKTKINNSHMEDYQELINNGTSAIYVVENKKIIALIGVKDIIRDSSKNIVKKLNDCNTNVVLLTGDNEKTAYIVANELGIKEVKASLLPSEKTDFITNLINDNHKVMMIGDGINDAPSLVAATIGVSINSGIDIAIASSDVILMNNNLENIIDLLEISKKSYRIMIENLFWAFLYNIIMIPVAIGLFENIGIRLNPMIASIMMIISSLTVTINSLRLRSTK